MTAAVFWLQPTFEAPVRPDSGVSDAARVLRRRLDDIDHRGTSVVLEMSSYDARRGLLELLAECSRPGWDGYGAVPPNLTALRRAWNVLGQLPRSVPAPEVSIHPDGEIALEWISEGDAILTATVADDPWIKWAAIIHGERLYGRIPYADSLPARLHQLVSEVIGLERPPQRPGHGAR